MATPTDAPLFHDVALGPEGGRAVWLTAEDGVRIRLALWPSHGAKGTVLMFPGRTEYIEKYGLLAADLAKSGYAMAAVDWRGQGLADRPAEPRDLGHVDDFDDYQLDVRAVVAALGAMPDAPKPWHLLAHSMGGAIGFRALAEALDVQGLAFTAPMWGLHVSPLNRVAAGVLGWISRPLGLEKLFAPGTGPAVAMEFKDNPLTTDRAQFQYMEHQTETYPDLALGGPSIRWGIEALAICNTIQNSPPPAAGALVFMGSHEQIADNAMIQRRVDNWPGAEAVILDGARHEVLMEAPDFRDAALKRIIAWFDAAA